MKKWWLFGLLAIIALGITNFVLQPEPQDAAATKDLPWQIDITPAGNTRVFDINVGAATVKQISAQRHLSPEIALFQAPDGNYRLESYLGKIKLGPFQARVILRLDASEQLLAEFAANSPSRQATPSGNHQLRLSGDDFETARELIVNELSYSPAVDTDAELLENLFGTPDARISVDDKSRYWTYPERGLVILLNDEDKDVFHYFPPRDFARVMNDIKQLQQAAEPLIPEG